MKYISHDCNAGDDPRIVKVRLKYNIAGYGVYFRCLEFIGTKVTEQYRDCTLEPDLELLAHDFNIPQTKIKEILDYFVELGLFDLTKNGKYRCLKIWDRIDEYTKRRAKKMEKKESERQGSVSVPTVSRHDTDKDWLKEKKRDEKKRNEMKGHLKPLQPSITAKDKAESKAGATLLDSKSLKKQHSPLLSKI